MRPMRRETCAFSKPTPRPQALGEKQDKVRIRLLRALTQRGLLDREYAHIERSMPTSETAVLTIKRYCSHASSQH